jgi:chemotaxis methyl-accepting protein methylase/signal transduction histidine kinase
MGLRGLERLDDYLEALRDDPTELRALVRDLLIHVTGFFRDPEAWQALARRVVQPLIARAPPGREIRAWVPACSTGEEAYSLAMVMTEECERADKHLDVKVFATDAAPEALDVARAGTYPQGIAAEIGPKRLERFFEPDEASFRVSKELRERLIFAPHNLLQDPPFSRIDLVSCRNFLIYLEPEMQRKVLGLLHFALRDGGCLFLGNAETIGREDDLFQPLVKKWRLYRRLSPAGHRVAEFPLVRKDDGPEAAAARPSVAILARQALIDRFAPPSVLVDRRQQVLYFHGAIDRYLVQPPGEPTRDLLDLVREPLRARLRTALRQAIDDGHPVRTNSVMTGEGGSSRRIELRVSPLAEPEGGGTLLVSFEEPAAEHRETAGEAEPATVAADATANRLEGQLRQAQEELRSTVEELETSNEELKASNEEVTSMNEELQSSNEELETSKEELQSLNEELTAVNHQLQSKVEELEEVTNDLWNLLNSTHIPTLFLDRELRIRRFTPAIRELVDLLPGDLGRPFGNLARKFDDPDLGGDIETVLRTLVPAEHEVPAGDGRWFQRRVLPYRTEDDRIDGVVVTFTEITERRRVEERLRTVNERLEHRVEERTASVRLLQDAAVIANQSRTIPEALQQTLDRVCSQTGWELGVALVPDDDGTLLPPDQIYACDGLEPGSVRTGLEKSGSMTSVRRLAERVIRGREAAWAKVDLELGGRRMRAAIGFPVPRDGEVAAVLAFVSRTEIEAPDPLLEVMANVGTQLGRVFERRALEQTIVELTERQEQRLAEHFHDTLGQQVAGLLMLAKGLERKLAAAERPEAEAAERLVAAARVADGQLRQLTRGLAPPTVGGPELLAAIEGLIEHTRETYGIEIDLELPRRLPIADEMTATALYRMLSEALHNVVKHAGDGPAVVSLAVRRGMLTLRVQDGGNGFDGQDSENGLGLRLMRHRAALIGAEVRIDSAPGEGAEIVFKLPVGGERR